MSFTSGKRSEIRSMHTTLLRTLNYRFFALTHLKKKSNFSDSHQIACFKVTTKSYNVATRIAEPRRVKKAQNSQRSKASNAVLVTEQRGGVKSFRGLEACNLVTATVVYLWNVVSCDVLGYRSIQVSVPRITSWPNENSICLHIWNMGWLLGLGINSSVTRSTCYLLVGGQSGLGLLTVPDWSGQSRNWTSCPGSWMGHTRDAKCPGIREKASGKFLSFTAVLQVASLHRTQLSPSHCLIIRSLSLLPAVQRIAHNWPALKAKDKRVVLKPFGSFSAITKKT
jgi:hypothetical protein